MKRYLNWIVAVLFVAALAGCSRQMRATRHQKQADGYFAAGQYSEAEVEYLNVLRLDRGNAHGIARLGTIYSEEGRIARAYPYLTKAHELIPQDMDIAVKVAMLELVFGNPKQARVAANAILSQSPTNADAPVLLARTALSKTDLQEVRDRLGQLTKQIGDTAPVRLAQGALRLQEGDVPGALAEYKKGLALDPKYSLIHSALGSLYWAQNNLTNADAEMKTAADLSPPRAAQRLEYASFKIKTGQVEAGKALLTQMTKDTPDALLAWLGLAEIAMVQQQTNEFKTLIGHALGQDPNDYQGLLLNSRQKLGTGDYDGAIADLDRMTALYAHSAPAHYYLGLAYARKGDSTRALSNLADALNVDPNLDEAILLQAQLNLQRDNATAAVPALNQLLKRRPQLAEPYLLLGDYYSKKNMLDEALANYRRLGELYPTNAQTGTLIGDVLQRQGKTAEARQAFGKSLAADPNYLPAFEKLVSLDLSEKKTDAALSRLQAEVAKKPQSPTLQMLLSQVYLARQDNAGAETALRKALALDANFQPAYLMLAQLYSTTKRDPAALEQLEAGLSRNPQETSLLMLKGMIEEKIQNFPAAREAYEKLLAVAPTFGPAWNNVAYIYSEKLNDPEKALAAARKAREFQPADPASADTLGWVLYKRGEYAAALPLLQESAAKLPDEPEVRYHLGMTYYLLDDEENARKALGFAAAAPADFSGKSEAEECLTLLALDVNHAAPEAVAGVQSRLKSHPADVVALGRWAEIQAHAGKWDEAVDAYDAALKQNPNNVQWLVAQARIYSEHLHNPQKALAVANDAYKLAPENADIAYSLGRLAFAAGDFKWALNLLQLAAQAQPQNPERSYDLALADYSLGHVAEAATDLQSALRQTGGFTRAATAKQMLEMITAAGQPDLAAAAEAKAQGILQASPTSVPALMVVATAAQKRGDVSAATRNCEQAIAVFPEFLPAIRLLVLLQADQPGAEQKVYELALKAHERLPDDLDITRTLGLVAYRRGDFRSAARFLDTSTQAGAADGRSWFCLGMAQFRLKNLKESKSALLRAQTSNLPADLADELKKTLAQLK